MDLEALASSPVGVLVPISGYDPRFREHFSYQAFLPHDLPDRVELRGETYQAVIDATVAVARLDQAATGLPNPMLLARPTTRREAVSTSALEGTYAALSDVLEADLAEARNSRVPSRKCSTTCALPNMRTSGSRVGPSH